MDLDFTSEQEMLRDSAARFLANECPYDRVKELEETEEGYDPALWQQVAELGWTGMAFPEEYGGYGSDFMDLVVIEEQIGKFVFPSPFFSTVVQCGFAILEGGTEEQKADLLAQIAEGSLIMALAHYDEDGSFAPELISMTAKADGDGYVLDGTKCIVMDANVANKLLVAAKAGDAGLSLFIVDADAPGVTVTKLYTVGKDNTCVVEFKGVKVGKDAILGQPGNGVDVLNKMYAKAAICKAAEMVGGMRVAIDMTADYAKQREQYGKPIGGYQAIQHYMANMLLGYDVSSNYLYRVTAMVDEGQDFATEASALKALVNQNFRFVTERSVQIHGGIGTTREADIALFYRRVFTNEPTCGDTEYHYEQVAQTLLKGGVDLY